MIAIFDDVNQVLGLLKAFPEAYRDLLHKWENFTKDIKKTDNTTEAILNQPLYFNPKLPTMANPENPFPSLPRPTRDTRKQDIQNIANLCKLSTPGLLTAEELEITTKTLSEITKRIPTAWLTTLNSETEKYPYKKYIPTIHIENKDKKLTQVTAR